jgi:NAD(P)H-hydrate repair Nnr-like enzyme with NAD(P)H-hydrate dehydratase domain
MTTAVAEVVDRATAAQAVIDADALFADHIRRYGP